MHSAEHQYKRLGLVTGEFQVSLAQSHPVNFQTDRTSFSASVMQPVSPGALLHRVILLHVLCYLGYLMQHTNEQQAESEHKS